MGQMFRGAKTRFLYADELANPEKGHTRVVARDWWWPWWVSSLIDVGVFAIALVVFVRAKRRLARQVATVVGIGAIVAAGLAPVVMKHKGSSPPMRMHNEPTMTSP